MQKTHNGTNNNTIRVLEAAPSPSPPPTTSANGGGVPACASCRHQRKKCTEKCVLAPFFPAEKTQDFQAVHKIFGVSNVTKLVKDLSREDGKKAVDSLIWEANCRIKDPVNGPLGEFQRVCDELRLYKTQYQANIYHNNRQVPPIPQNGVNLYNNNKSLLQPRSIESWNGDHNNLINNGTSRMEYILSNGGCIDNPRKFPYGSLQNIELKPEREQQVSLIHPQPQMMNDYPYGY
ncbi:LOB domain-containing protein 2 [Tanacetum coccineum]